MRYLWLLALAVADHSAERTAAQRQALDRLQEALEAHRNADVIAQADGIIAETEASLKGERRKVYSSQTIAATLLDQPEQAGAYLDRAVAISPHAAQFLCEDGYWHAHHRDPAGALELYRRCESDSGLADETRRARWKAAGLRVQGFALIDLGRLDEAETRYKQSLAVEPNDTHALNDLRYIAGQKYKAAQPH